MCTSVSLKDECVSQKNPLKSVLTYCPYFFRIINTPERLNHLSQQHYMSHICSQMTLDLFFLSLRMNKQKNIYITSQEKRHSSNLKLQKVACRAAGSLDRSQHLSLFLSLQPAVQKRRGFSGPAASSLQPAASLLHLPATDFFFQTRRLQGVQLVSRFECSARL